MSKEKDPYKKKQLSLKRDRRRPVDQPSVPGRKEAALGKKRSHRQERHAVNHVLIALERAPDDDDVEAADNAVKVTGRVRKVEAFKKPPDVPLMDVIEKKRLRRTSPSRKPEG